MSHALGSPGRHARVPGGGGRDAGGATPTAPIELRLFATSNFPLKGCPAMQSKRPTGPKDYHTLLLHNRARVMQLLQWFERGAAHERTARLVVWSAATPDDLSAFRRSLSAYFPALEAFEPKTAAARQTSGFLELAIATRVSDDIEGGPEGGVTGDDTAGDAAGGGFPSAICPQQQNPATFSQASAGVADGPAVMAAGVDAAGDEDLGWAAPEGAAAAADRLAARGGAPARALGVVNCLADVARTVAEQGARLLQELSEALEEAAADDTAAAATTAAIPGPAGGGSLPMQPSATDAAAATAGDLAACVGAAANNMRASAEATTRVADALASVALQMRAVAGADAVTGDGSAGKGSQQAAMGVGSDVLLAGLLPAADGGDGFGEGASSGFGPALAGAAALERGIVGLGLGLIGGGANGGEGRALRRAGFGGGSMSRLGPGRNGGGTSGNGGPAAGGFYTDDCGEGFYF